MASLWVPGLGTGTSGIYREPLQVPGGGGAGVKAVGFVHSVGSLCFSSLCQTDQPHAVLL